MQTQIFSIGLSRCETCEAIRQLIILCFGSAKKGALTHYKRDAFETLSSESTILAVQSFRQTLFSTGHRREGESCIAVIVAQNGSHHFCCRMAKYLVSLSTGEQLKDLSQSEFEQIIELIQCAQSFFSQSMLCFNSSTNIHTSIHLIDLRRPLQLRHLHQTPSWS